MGEKAVLKEVRKTQFRDSGGGFREEFKEALGGACHLLHRDVVGVSDIKEHPTFVDVKAVPATLPCLAGVGDGVEPGG